MQNRYKSRRFLRAFAPLREALILALLAWSGVAGGAEPALSSIEPFGFQRGRETDVRFAGARLGDAEQLLFYSPGLTTLSITPSDDNQFVARLAVADDCAPGIHAVRVRTSSGISNLQLFSVGVLPDVTEVEPNGDFTQPQPISLDSTVNGVVENEDVDYYVVEARQGERITAELEGIRLGYTFFDPSLSILDAQRFELAVSDDFPLLRQDPLCAVVAPEDGRYIIQVRECSYGGDGNSKYRLHVGRFPRPRAVLPSGGRPGETLVVRYIGDVAGEWTESVTLPGQPQAAWTLFARDPHGTSPSPNCVQVVDAAGVLEVEPNQGPAEATAAVAPPAVLHGVIDPPQDVDYFRFQAGKDQVLDIRVYARTTLRSPLDSVLEIHNAEGAAIAGNDDNGMPDSFIRFTAPADGEYLVSVRDHLGGGGPTYVYAVEVSAPQPVLSLGLPERVQYVPVTLSVPQGNRMALLVSAARADFSAQLQLDVQGLPAGMTVQTVPWPADQSMVPVLFSAAVDAPKAGGLVDVIGRPVDDEPPVTGHLRQRTMLVRGQNNIDVWGHDADRMAAAVTGAVPFRIDVVEPKVPLVRYGAMQLKVVASRTEGFGDPIQVQLLNTPAGVGASASVSIPAGQNEAVIPLTAASNAQLGKWPIVVIGTARVGNGNVEVASQLAELEVAEALLSFAFEKAAAEQGATAQVVVRVQKNRDFEGTARAELLGLPANTSTSTVAAIDRNTSEVVFPVDVAKEARPGIYGSLVVRSTLVVDGEPIEQTIGTGELRVDEPLPPKPSTEPVAEQAAAQPAAAAEPAPPKRLSRLEQLRLEKQQKGAAAGQAAPP
jgi:hypothetical protein